MNIRAGHMALTLSLIAAACGAPRPLTEYQQAEHDCQYMNLPACGRVEELQQRQYPPLWCENERKLFPEQPGIGICP